MNGKSKGELIRVAAELVTCNALSELYALTENQKTVSTLKLANMLYEAEEKLKRNAVTIKRVIDQCEQ